MVTVASRWEVHPGMSVFLFFGGKIFIFGNFWLKSVTAVLIFYQTFALCFSIFFVRGESILDMLATVATSEISHSQLQVRTSFTLGTWKCMTLLHKKAKCPNQSGMFWHLTCFDPSYWQPSAHTCRLHTMVRKGLHLVYVPVMALMRGSVR